MNLDEGAPRTLVIGGGVAGLAAALESQARGERVLLLEAADRVGGKLASRRVDGFLLESGAVGVLDRAGDFAALASGLGLAPVDAAASARDRWVEREGIVHKLPAGPAGLIATRLLGAREKLGILREPWREPWVAGAAREDESVADFFTRRFGAAGAFLGDALQTGIFAGDPRALEMRSCFPQLAEAERKSGSLLRALRRGALGGGAGRGAPARRERPRLQSFAQGMQELPAALERQLGASVRRGVRVGSVRARPGGGFDVQVDSSGEVFGCEHLILAVPARACASLLRDLDPDLASLCEPLAPAAPLTLVHLALPTPAAGPRAGSFGVLAPGRPVAGALFPAALWPDRAPRGQTLVTALVGGAREPRAAALPDAELVALVRAELGPRLRWTAEPRCLDLLRWPEAIPQYDRGHAGRLSQVEARLARHPGLTVTGASFRGVGVLDCLRDGRRQAAALAALKLPSRASSARLC